MLFSNKEYKREGDTLDMEEKGRLKKLLDDRDKYLDRAFELDQKIVALEESTKTLVPAMTPVHNYLRMKFKWYYNWHMKPYAHKVHWTILGISMSAMMLGIFFSVSVPNPVEKTVGATGCVSIKDGNWSDVTVWDGCADIPPRMDDDVTIANHVTIDDFVGVNSLTISNGKTLDTSGTQDIYIYNSVGGGASFTNSGGTFTPGNSTVYFPNYIDGITLTSGNITFNNFTTQGMSLIGNEAINIGSGVLTINGNLTLSTSDRGAAPTYTVTYTMGNNITVSGTTTLTKAGAYGASKLDTKSGSNYTLTTGALSIASGATLAANASTINVVNSWTNAGTFTYGTSTVNFTGTATNNTINNGSGGNFYKLTINSSDGNGVWSPLTNTLTITNDLTMTSGTLNTANGTANIAVNGNTVGTNGVIDMTTAGTNTFTAGTINGGNKTFGTTSGTAAWKFYNLTIAGGQSTISVNTGGSGDITIAGTLTSNSITTNMGNRIYHLTGATPIFDLQLGGSFNGQTSTFSFEKTSGTITIPIEPYNNLTFAPASGTPTYNLDFAEFLCLLPGTKITTANGIKNIEDLVKGDQVLSYDYSLNNIVSDIVTNTLKTKSDNYYSINNKVKATWNHRFYLENGELKMAQDLNVGDILKTQSGTEVISTIEKINQSSDVYDISVEKNHNFFADGYLVHNANTNGTLTIGGNLLMTGAGAATLSASATKAFNTVVNGNVTIGTGHTYAIATGSDSNPASLTIKGNYSNSGTFTPSTGTVTFSGTSGTQTIDTGGTGAGKKFYNMAINNSGTSVQLVNSDMTMNTSGNITMTAGTLDLNGRTLTLASSLTTAAGTIAIGTGTLSGASYNLTVNSGGTVTQSTGTINVANLTIGASGVYTCSGNSNINLTGNWSRTGTFTASTSTVTFNGSGTQTITGTNTWNNITVNNTAASPTSNYVDPSSAQTISGTLLITDGEYKANTGDILGDVTISAAGYFMEDSSSSITISGNFTLNGGTYNSNGNMITFTGVGKSIGGSSASIVFVTQFVVNAGASLTVNIASTTIYAPITANGTLTIGASKTVTATDTITIGASGLIDGTNVATSALNVSLPTITLGGTNNFGSNLHLTFDASNSNGTLSNLGGVPYGAGKVTIYATVLTGTRTVTPAAGTMHFDGDFELYALKGVVSTTLDFNNSNNTAITFSGNFTRTESGGGVAKYTKGASDTITFDSAGTQTFNSGTSSTFNNITHSGAGTLQLATTALTVSGNLTNSNGTLDTAGIQLTTTGDLIMNGGTLSNSTGTANVTVNGNVNGTGGTINLTSGTLTQRIGSAKTFGTTSGSVDWTFSNLTFTNSSAGNLAVTANTGGTGKIITTGTLTVGSGSDTNTTTLDCATNNRTVDAVNLTIASKGSFSAPSTLTVSGNLANSGTFTPGSGTLTIDGSSTTLNMGSSAINNFNNNLSGTLTLGSALTVNGNFTNTTGTFAQGAYAVKVKGDFTVDGNYTQTTGLLTLANGGDSIFNTASIWFGDIEIGASPDSLTLATNMLAESITINEGDTLFANGHDIDVSGDILVNGTLDTTDKGEVYSYGNGTTINPDGNFTISASGNFVKSLTESKKSLIYLDSGTTKNFTSSGEDMGNIELQNAYTHVNLQDALTVDDININVGATLDASDFNVTCSGDWDIYGTYLMGNNTTIFDSSGTQILLDGTGLDSLSHTGSGLLSIEGDLYISGDFTNSAGTFSQEAGTVEFLSDDATQITTGGIGDGHSFYNFKKSAGNGKLTLNSDLDVNNDITVGFIDYGAHTVYVGGNWTGSIMEAYVGTSTIVFDATDNNNWITFGAPYPFFYNVTFNNGGTWVIDDGYGVSGVLYFKNNLIVNGNFGAYGESLNTIVMEGNVTGTGTIDFRNVPYTYLHIPDTTTANSPFLFGSEVNTTNKWSFHNLKILNQFSDSTSYVSKKSTNNIDITGYFAVANNINFIISPNSEETWTITSKGGLLNVPDLLGNAYAVSFGTNSTLEPGHSTFLIQNKSNIPSNIGPTTFYDLEVNPDYEPAGAGTVGGLVVGVLGCPTQPCPTPTPTPTPSPSPTPPPTPPADVLVVAAAYAGDFNSDNSGLGNASNQLQCFEAGTDVATPDGTKNIEDIKKGDVVTSYDKDLGKLVDSNVTNTIKTSADSYLIINNKISATEDQAFILSDGSQKSADNLKVGDVLRVANNGEERISSIEKINKKIDVYDISLDRSNLFYANNYLVHNAGGLLKVLNDFLLSKTGNYTASASFTGAGTGVNGVVVNGKLTVESGTTYHVAAGETSVLNSVEVKSGGTFDNGSGTLNITGDYSNNGSYTHGTGTLNFNGTSNQTINTAGAALYNLSHNGNSTLIANTNDIDLQNNFTNTGGTFNLNGKNMNIAGNYTNTANITPGSGTVTFDGSGTQLLNSGGSTSGKQFGNLSHSGSGKVQLASNNIQVNGNLVNSAGTFDANGLDIFAYKNWDFGGGTFYAGATPGEQSVFMYGDDAATIVGNTTFNNLIFENYSSQKAISFTAGSKQTVNKEINFNGDLSLNSTKAGTQWQLSLADNYYFDAPLITTDSKINDPYKVYAGTNVIDGGNNTNWMFGYTGITSSTSSIKSIETQRISLNPPANFNIQIDVGEGGKYLRGKIIISNLLGKVVETITLNEKLAKDSLGKFNFKWNYPWWRIGVYKVQVLAAYGAKEDAVNNVSYIFIIPWWLLLVLFGVLAPLLYWLARKYAYKSIIKRLMTTKYSKIKKEETAPVNDPHDYDS